MPKLMTIKRDDCFLPRGWVSAALGDSESPSDYEKSSGLWDIVEVPFAVAATPPPGGRLVLDHGRLREIKNPGREIAASLARPNLKPFFGPPHLDRSHSTVWDYGPGRTYSAPQLAFDALLAQVGVAEFNETHYVRGWSGSYPSSYLGWAPLYVYGVTPTSRFPLVADANEGEEVVLDPVNLYPHCLEGEAVSHVKARRLTLRGASYSALRINWDTAPVTRWDIENCVIHGVSVGIQSDYANHFRVKDCRITGVVNGILTGGQALAGNHAAMVSGCLIVASSHCIFNNGADVALVLANNTLVSDIFGLRHDRASGDFVIPLMINNIFVIHSDATCAAIKSTYNGPAGARVLRSGGNCFHLGNAKAARLLNTDMTLADWREYFGVDDDSILADPLLDENYRPSAASPCLGEGVTVHPVGASGLARAASVDIGHDQLTRARVASVAARRAAEIVRK